MENITRREFLGHSATAGGAIAGLGALAAMTEANSPAGNPLGLKAASFLNGTAALSKPLVSDSQLGFRIGLARRAPRAIRWIPWTSS